MDKAKSVLNKTKSLIDIGQGEICVDRQGEDCAEQGETCDDRQGEVCAEQAETCDGKGETCVDWLISGFQSSSRFRDLKIG